MSTVKRRVGIASIILTILTFAITLTINFRPLYSWDITHLDILDYVNIDSKTELLENFDQLMHFLNSPFTNTLSMTDFQSSSSGIKHFQDVKVLFLVNYAVLLITIIPSVLFFFQLKKDKHLFFLQKPLTITAIAPLILGMIMVFNFNFFFTSFHQLLFSNDDWLFDPITDPIILALPAEFFMHCFILFFVLFELLVLALLSYIKISKKKLTQ